MKTDWTRYGIPSIYADKPYDIYEDKKRLIEICMDFLNDKPLDGQKRWCLYVHGAPGCGKTHFACCALKAFVIKNQQHSAQFFSCKVYFTLLQEQFGDTLAAANTQRKLQDLDLIVLDDLGVSRGTDWQREKIYDLLEERFNSGKKTIISSNLSLQQNNEGATPFFDDRLYRRIKEGKVIPLIVSKDHGKKNALYVNEYFR